VGDERLRAAALESVILDGRASLAMTQNQRYRSTHKL
jgi:hypothetical protein